MGWGGDWEEKRKDNLYTLNEPNKEKKNNAKQTMIPRHTTILSHPYCYPDYVVLFVKRKS